MFPILSSSTNPLSVDKILYVELYMLTFMCCISQGSPEKQTNRICIKETEIYYKELAHVIMKSGKFQELQGESAKLETQ